MTVVISTIILHSFTHSDHLLASNKDDLLSFIGVNFEKQALPFLSVAFPEPDCNSCTNKHFMFNVDVN